jgi:hypothetical protein
MSRSVKWLVLPAVVVAALLFASPRSAEARRFVVRPHVHVRPHATYVYTGPRRVYYTPPAPVIVRQPAVILYGPTVAPAPAPVYYYGW